MKKSVAAVLILAMLLSLLAGCEKAEDKETINNNSREETLSETTETATQTGEPEAARTAGDMFTHRDWETDYEAGRAVTIRLEGSSATASSNSVSISGGTVKITEAATYLISGTLTDGMLIVDAEDTAKVQLVLNGVDIQSKTSAALYILEADKVFVTLAEGTQNTLANAGSFTAIDESNIDGAVFSKQDLTLNGAGSLTVTSPAGHGIVCKDDLVITGGNYTLQSASHGLTANDSVRIAEASLTIDAGKDGIHAENSEDTALGFVYIASGTVKAEAEGDGISASADMQIADGTIELLTGGGAENGAETSSQGYGGFMGGGHGGMRPGDFQSAAQTEEEDSTSMKGIKAESSLLITGGVFRIDAADDALHANGSVTITDGTFDLASGDDAVHGEETLRIAGGSIAVSECYEGLEALHVQVEGGDISLVARDDGLNAAGGTDQSGTTGGRDGMFGGMGGMGGRPGGMSSNSNGSILISGGNLYINASGDGLDANGTLQITGGQITVEGPARGDTATLDYDKSGTITGGTFIGTGASGMAQSFSDSGQGVIAVSVGSQAAGTQILLQDAEGNAVLSHTPSLDFAVVILSSPDIQKGETYQLSVGAAEGEITAS